MLVWKINSTTELYLDNVVVAENYTGLWLYSQLSNCFFCFVLQGSKFNIVLSLNPQMTKKKIVISDKRNSIRPRCVNRTCFVQIFGQTIIVLNFFFKSSQIPILNTNIPKTDCLQYSFKFQIEDKKWYQSIS